ncbi:MAG: hypothetical protein DI527_00615 [Chelatococcus sp.]|nr:MAG: hypothetical protein DI527_00615 [Chelatococcus sp.]
MATKRKIAPLTEAEEAEIQRQIAADPDDAEATDEQIAQAKPFAEAFPELAASIKRTRGAGKKEKKELVTLRLDRDVVNAFKADGSGWQSRVNDVLRKAKRLPKRAV